MSKMLRGIHILEAVLDKLKENQSGTSEEQEKQKIRDLLAKLPPLERNFTLHHKIGAGTYSSVYLGSLRAQESLPIEERSLYAIKHHEPLSHPLRVESELRCLRNLGGKNNVIGIEFCLRQSNTIVFIMPYFPHQKFHEYVRDMDNEELVAYMRGLLTALRHVHSFGIIHRDIKPCNFLYDREKRRYLLVDFGLAQPVSGNNVPPPAHRASQPKIRRVSPTEGSSSTVQALDLSMGRPRSPPAPAPASAAAHSSTEATASTSNVETAVAPRPLSGRCAIYVSHPPRAGTQGYRAPEVLMKSLVLGTAVDMWAAGVVLASVLCLRYPFFHAANDRKAALAEQMDLLGTEPMQRAAVAMGLHLEAPMPRRGLCLRRLCALLRGAPLPPRASPQLPPPDPDVHCDNCRQPQPDCVCADENVPVSEWRPERTVAGFPDSAFALLGLLLEPNPKRRISAEAALQHPFLQQP